MLSPQAAQITGASSGSRISRMTLRLHSAKLVISLLMDSGNSSGLVERKGQRFSMTNPKNPLFLENASTFVMVVSDRSLLAVLGFTPSANNFGWPEVPRINLFSSLSILSWMSNFTIARCQSTVSCQTSSRMTSEETRRALNNLLTRVGMKGLGDQSSCLLRFYEHQRLYSSRRAAG